MRSVAGALAIGAAIALCATPTWAQEEESAAPAPANHETAKPARTKEPAEPVREAAEPAPAAAEESAGEPSNEAAPAKKRVRHRRARVVPARAAQPAAPPEPAPVEAKPAALPTEEKPTALPAAAPPAEVKVAAPIDTLPVALPAEAMPAAAVEDKPVPASAKPTVIPTHHAEAEPAAGHGAEHGAEHGEHAAFSVKTFVLQLINFGVLLFLLIYYGGRALNKSLRARHEQLKGDINESTRLRDEAKQNFDAQERRVAKLEKEIAALRESMRQDAAHEQARMLEAAQERGKQMQKEMRIQIDEQVKVAEAQLRAEVANASVKSAEELVRKAVNFDDERRLAREFVAGFDEPSGPGGEVS